MPIKVGDVIEVEHYPEPCCEECGEIIHNHMTCPVCGDEYASTSVYMSFSDWFTGSEKELVCEECLSVFHLVNLRNGLFKLVEAGKDKE